MALIHLYNKGVQTVSPGDIAEFKEQGPSTCNNCGLYVSRNGNSVKINRPGLYKVTLLTYFSAGAKASTPIANGIALQNKGVTMAGNSVADFDTINPGAEVVLQTTVCVSCSCCCSDNAALISVENVGANEIKLDRTTLIVETA